MTDEPVARGTTILDEIVRAYQSDTLNVDANLSDRVSTALDIDDVARSYALVTQPLCKLLYPVGDIRSLDASDWEGFSPRTLCKTVVVTFNEAHLGPLKVSDDPYVSNPLRRGILGSDEWNRGRRAPDVAAWQPVIDLLADVESSADPRAAAEDLLTAVVARLLELAVTPSSLLTEMLTIQAEIKSGTDLYDRRHDLLVGRGARSMERLLKPLNLDLSVQASTGLGTPAEIPWLRVYNPEHSPSATSGEYLVYLFSADGSSAFLSLIVGTEGMTLDAIDARVAHLRSRLGPVDEVVDVVDLHADQSAGRPRSYERGTVYAIEYEAGAIPDDDALIADLQRMVGLLAQIEASAPEDPGGLLHRLDLRAVRDALGDLIFPDSLLLDAIAALRSGKHLLLTGPPGTGKTTLGQALAEAAQTQGVCEGWSTVTAVATWTMYDTVGGYQQQMDGTLRFSPGVALRSIDANQWLVIDELNRADIDKALGPLFTVLSGQAVELTLEESLPNGSQAPVAIVPASSLPRVGASTHFVQPGWRLIATMNSWDQDLLFTMSYALLRRFAVIHVDPPHPDELTSLLGEVEPIGDADLAESVAALTRLPHIHLGPAILRSTARLARERQVVGLPDEGADDWLRAALTSEVVPQLGHLSPSQLADVAGYVYAAVLRSTPLKAVREYFEKHLGQEIPAPAEEDETLNIEDGP